MRLTSQVCWFWKIWKKKYYIYKLSMSTTRLFSFISFLWKKWCICITMCFQPCFLSMKKNTRAFFWILWYQPYSWLIGVNDSFILLYYTFVYYVHFVRLRDIFKWKNTYIKSIIIIKRCSHCLILSEEFFQNNNMCIVKNNIYH